MKSILAALFAIAALAHAGSARAQVFGQYTGAAVVQPNARVMGAYLTVSEHVVGGLAQLRLSFYPNLDFGFHGGLAQLEPGPGVSTRTILRVGSDLRWQLPGLGGSLPTDLAIGACLGVETADRLKVVTLGPTGVASRAIGGGEGAKLIPYAGVALLFSSRDAFGVEDSDISLPLRLGLEARLAPEFRMVAELQLYVADRYNHRIQKFGATGAYLTQWGSNGGGNVSQQIIERLRRKLLGTNFGSTRDDHPGTYPSVVFTGPMVCLLNETSASDGDIFPYMFRQAGLGPLIGKRSWGGVVGISGRGPLIDGGDASVPLSGMASAEGQYVIEGHGVDPDVVDYVAASPVFATPTKADVALPLGLAGLDALAKRTPLPVVAIGGIDAGNAADAIANGADGVAVVSAIMASPQPRAAARSMRAAVDAALAARGARP